MNDHDIKPESGAGTDEPSAGLEIDAAADAAAGTPPSGAPGPERLLVPTFPIPGGALQTAAPDAGESTSADTPGAGARPTQESTPWKPGPTTDLDAAAHAIIDGPEADPPRVAPRVRPQRPATPESPPGRGPPRAPPSEQLRSSAAHTHAETPGRGHAPPSDMTGPMGRRTVAETPGGPSVRVRAGRVAGIAQDTSHAHGETPAGGDSRAMEQRMHPKGSSASLVARLAEVQAQRAARIADPPERAKRRRAPRRTEGKQRGPQGLAAHIREVVGQRSAAAKK